MLLGLNGIQIFYFLVALLISMVIHEVMHGVTAQALGDSTAADLGRLTLNPLKHIDVITTILLPLILVIAHQPPIMAAKPVPFNPERVKFGVYGAALVGLAGPATNFVLAVIGALLLHLVNNTGGLAQFLSLFMFVNVLLMVFNLIPFPPLDGSRVLYAFAPEPVQEIMEKIESFGFISILIFIFIAFQFLSGPIIRIEDAILGWLVSI